MSVLHEVRCTESGPPLGSGCRSASGTHDGRVREYAPLGYQGAPVPSVGDLLSIDGHRCGRCGGTGIEPHDPLVKFVVAPECRECGGLGWVSSVARVSEVVSVPAGDWSMSGVPARLGTLPASPEELWETEDRLRELHPRDLFGRTLPDDERSAS